MTDNRGRIIRGTTEHRTLCRHMRRAYENGATIRQLADQHGRSYGWAHRMLAEAGTQMRDRRGTRP